MTKEEIDDIFPKPGPDDLVIDDCRLLCTSIACPEQYEVFDDKTREHVGYLRLRHGHFRAHYPHYDGKLVYESNPAGDGMFDDAERMAELTKAIAAIQAARKQE